VRAAVLGSPIAHSLSPLLHRAAYQALDLDWQYDAIEVSSEGLAAFVDAVGPEWAGLSLTMPLKEAVLPLLTSQTPLVTATGAANTVVVEGGARVGHNTDVSGILAALAEAGVDRVGSAVVLGGGATARSALAALHALGCHEPTLVVRSEPAATLAAAKRLGVRPSVVGWSPSVLDGAELVISTVPAGAADGLAPYAASVPVLLDVVYDPWPTPLAAACTGLVIMGSAMLLHQAAAQVELMTGLVAPVAAMRAALEGAQAPGPLSRRGD
jgi:shikimate dehydrogenase